MTGFKGLTQSGITLSVGQSVTLKLTLEVGAIAERVDVTAKAPLLDTTSVSSGQTYDQALISGLPMAANMPILLTRFAQGVVSPTTQVQVISGQIDGPTNARRHRARRRRRLQLHDRRRHQRRQQPPHRELAQRRHDRGDARRDVQLRRRAGPRHRRARSR